MNAPSENTQKKKLLKQIGRIIADYENLRNEHEKWKQEQMALADQRILARLQPVIQRLKEMYSKTDDPALKKVLEVFKEYEQRYSN